MVAVKKNQSATIQNTNKSVRRSAVVEVEISSAESNAPVSHPRRQSWYLRNFESLHTKDQTVVAQACFFASSFSAVSHMGRGHQLVGVSPESPASAEIKTTKISSEESARFSAKICTSENFPLYGIWCAAQLTLLNTYVPAWCRRGLWQTSQVEDSLTPQYLHVHKVE